MNQDSINSYLINILFPNGNVFNDLKVAVVLPMYKNNVIQEAWNPRPISNSIYNIENNIVNNIKTITFISFI